MDSSLEEADNSTYILILLILEPWISVRGQPPSALHYDHFCSTKNKTESITYIRKNLGLNQRNITSHDHSIKVTVTLNSKPIEINKI